MEARMNRKIADRMLDEVLLEECPAVHEFFEEGVCEAVATTGWERRLCNTLGADYLSGGLSQAEYAKAMRATFGSRFTLLVKRIKEPRGDECPEAAVLAEACEALGAPAIDCEGVRSGEVRRRVFYEEMKGTYGVGKVQEALTAARVTVLGL